MIPSVVVDTDVISFVFKRDTRADLYEHHLAGNLIVVSFMTIAELDRWALQHAWGEARRSKLEAFLQKYLIPLVIARFVASGPRQLLQRATMGGRYERQTRGSRLPPSFMRFP